MKPLRPVLLVTLAVVAVGCHKTVVHHSPPRRPRVVAPAPPAPTPKTAPRQAPARVWVYHYYSDVEVYFCPRRNLYFWVEGERWVSGAVLPRRYVLVADRRADVGLDTDRPFTRHATVVVEHPRRKVERITRIPGKPLRRGPRPVEDPVVPPTPGGWVYHYYPALEVYFCPRRNLYFWRTGTTWRSGDSLPKRFVLSTRRHVVVELDTHRPFNRHGVVTKKRPRVTKAKGRERQ